MNISIPKQRDAKRIYFNSLKIFGHTKTVLTVGKENHRRILQHDLLGMIVQPLSDFFIVLLLGSADQAIYFTVFVMG